MFTYDLRLPTRNYSRVFSDAFAINETNILCCQRLLHIKQPRSLRVIIFTFISIYLIFM